MRYITTFFCTAVAICATSRSAVAQHAGDVWVGRSSAWQLKVGGFAAGDARQILPPTGGLFPGWSDNDPGFDRVVVSDVANDLLTLQSGVQVRLEVVAMDPALRMIDTGFQVLDMPGEQTLLGGTALHVHPAAWNININDDFFDPDEYLWDATFKVIDTGTTAYTESEPFTLHFLNVNVAAGDVNGDESVDFGDVARFVELLFDDSDATREERAAADMNLDRSIDARDMQAFVEAVLSGA